VRRSRDDAADPDCERRRAGSRKGTGTLLFGGVGIRGVISPIVAARQLAERRCVGSLSAGVSALGFRIDTRGPSDENK
jgi:hypothetical protein